MSGKEYSFHHRNAKLITPVVPSSQRLSDSAPSSGSVKELILGQYDHLIRLKTSHPKIKYLSETQEKLSQEIVATVGLLQKSPDLSTQLNHKLNHLTDLHKQLKDEYINLLKQQLSLVVEQWPGIFNMMLEGVNRDTLQHCLTIFEEHQKGQLDAKQAVAQGLDYMTLKYQLPQDFFNKDAIEQFSKGMHQPTDS